MEKLVSEWMFTEYDKKRGTEQKEMRVRKEARRWWWEDEKEKKKASVRTAGVLAGKREEAGGRNRT